MSNNKNIKPANRNGAAETGARLDATRIFLVVFACIALFGIIASIIFAVVEGSSKKSMDYMKANLSKYVYISKDLYDSYDVKVELPEVSDTDLQYALDKVLCQNKIIPDEPVISVPYVTLSLGDVANIYYRGYTFNDDGSKNYFDGGCNFSNSYTALEIGSGSFIPGFESGLVNKNQKDFATMTKLNDGTVQSGDIIKFTYSAYYADGTARNAQTATIDLGDPKTDEIWGKGFVEYFRKNSAPIGVKFGTNDKDDKTEKIVVDTVRESKDGAKDDVYFNMTISEVYRVSEGERLVVKTQFPVDYHEETLKGKKVEFEVYIITAKDYDVPELDEKFITETLKLTSDDLASYEGETLVDKYKAYVRAGLVEEYNEKVESVIDTAFWDHVIAGAEFKKLPEDEVEEKYNENIAQINATYNNGGYSTVYGDLDTFARIYLGLDSKDDWKATVRKNAERAIKQKLAFYYIIRKEDWVPNDEDYDKIYNVIFDEHLQTYLDYYNITEDSENYDEKLKKAKEDVNAQFADSYWEELVLYDYAMKYIIENANVTYAEQ